MAHISTSVMDLYALRLMSKWKIRKVNHLHSPIYIMPSVFSKIVLDDFVVGGVTTSFDDVKKYFLKTSEEGNIIFKHADRVFIAILSRTPENENDKLGVMKWWCICINFAQIRVDVLTGFGTKLDEESERCVWQIVQGLALITKSMIHLLS